MMRAAFFSCILIFSSLLSAEYGTIADVTESASNGYSNPYVRPLMHSVYRHLNHFLKNENITTPRQKIALLRAISGIFSVGYRDAVDTARQSAALAAKASGYDPSIAYRYTSSYGASSNLAQAKRIFDDLSRAACKDSCKPPRKRQERAAEHRAADERMKAQERARTLVLVNSWDSLKQGNVQEAYQIAYAVAEWVMLNEIAVNLIWILPDAYADELLWVSGEVGVNHPFKNGESFNRFVSRNSDDMSKPHMVFVNPLIAALDSWSGFSSVFQFIQGIDQDSSIVSLLPMEMVQKIVSKI